MTNHRTTDNFNDWMRRVDRILERKTGLTHLDMGDAPYRDNFDAGTTPAEMVRIALVDWNDMAPDEFEGLG